MSIALGELAVQFGCELRGDPAVRIAAVATLAAAGPGTLCFLANARYRPQLALTHASAVVLDAASAASCPAAVAALVSANPHAAFARIATLLHPPAVAPAGVHASAVVAPGVELPASAHVGAFAFIGAGAVIGERALVGPHCVIGAGVHVGADSRLVARVTLLPGVRLGARALIHPGAVLGADGFGYARDGAQWVKVPQLGGVCVGDDVEIGANTTIDRGAIEDTVIADGVKLDNQIQIGHNVQIGAHTAIAACTGVSGSTRIGARCMIGGATGINGHIQICDDVMISGMAMVTRPITRPGVYGGGFPAEPARSWRHLVARLRLLAREQGRGAGAATHQQPQDEDHDD